MAHIADYVILLTRTDPDVPKHKGLTFFLVPFDTPGIEIQPVPTMATERSNATFYDDVRLSDDWRVGEVNGGWAVMKTASNTSAASQVASSCHRRSSTRHRLGDQPRTGRRHPTDRRPGRARAPDPSADRRRGVRGFAYHCADLANEGAMFGVEGSMTKLFAARRSSATVERSTT